MSNLRYYNQSGPFWDFIAGLEGKDWSNHPFAAAFAGPSNQNREANEATEANEESETEKEAEEDVNAEAEFGAEDNHPWGGRGWGWGGRGFGGRGGRGRRERGPPGGFGRHGPPPPPFEEAGPSHGFEHHRGPPPPNDGEHQEPSPPEEEEGHGKGPRGPHHGPRGLGGPHRRDHGHAGGHRGGPHGRGGRGGCGARRGRGGPSGWGRGGNPFDMSNIAEFFQSQLFGGEGATRNVDGSADATNGDFVPPVDIFDTESAFVIHVSLPGAKKEDIAVSWDADKSELNITGIIHRPGDEEFLKTLALDERKVGAFERKVRLGSRANPAPVDAEGISAKLEDGILRLHVPKEDKEFDVIHKVDVE